MARRGVTGSNPGYGPCRKHRDPQADISITFDRAAARKSIFDEGATRWRSPDTMAHCEVDVKSCRAVVK
jgi:hypothetical protein